MAAPHRACTPDLTRPTTLIVRQALLEGLRLWGFAPETLGTNDPELLALTVPPIRADLAMRETYCAAAAADQAAGAPCAPRLPMPVHVFGGSEDNSCPVAHLAKWAMLAPTSILAAADAVPGASSCATPRGLEAEAEADGPFSCTMLPGGHFYFESEPTRATLLGHVGARLSACVRRLPVSIMVGPALPALPSLAYVHEMVEACAARAPHTVAIIGTDGTRLTYMRIVAEATLLGGWLVAAGAQPGTAVALLMGHQAECVARRSPPLSSASSCPARPWLPRPPLLSLPPLHPCTANAQRLIECHACVPPPGLVSAGSSSRCSVSS